MLEKERINLQLFAENLNVNTTTQTGTGRDLSAEDKIFYDKTLIRLAGPNIIHDQFGQKRNIPKNGGKTIEFRKFSPLGKATTPLTEGVTPEGQSLDVSKVEATVKQYGGYVTISDKLDMTAIDPVVTETISLISDQAAKTLDTIERDILCTGTNVQYAEGQVESRNALVGGKADGNHYLTVDAIRKAVRSLKRMNAETINGSYVGIIHPDAAYDLMSDPKWINVKTYSDPEGIYQGEIGKIENVRFVETSEAKIFEKAGAEGVDVYATLIIGENAYGTTDIAGGGLQHIVKQLGSAGTADPLNQRATAGWKATKTAVRLVEPYMVRIETASSF